MTIKLLSIENMLLRQIDSPLQKADGLIHSIATWEDSIMSTKKKKKAYKCQKKIKAKKRKK